MDCYRQRCHGICHDRDLLHDDRRCRNRPRLAYWVCVHRSLLQCYPFQGWDFGHGGIVHHNATLWLRDELCYIFSSALGIRKLTLSSPDAEHS